MIKEKRDLLLKELKITQERFDEIGLTWSAIDDIYQTYISEINDLNKAGEFIANNLMQVNNVHSVRFRVKNPEHLVSKIIRKRHENPERVITVNNFKEQITDLIGVRAIHLFKNQWVPIHEFVLKKWNIKEQPIAYIREGDSASYVNLFSEADFKIKTHVFGYRSLHYVISTKPAKDVYFAEIQVRTIFEEGWSEIDHDVRYPNETENALFSEFLLILNRLAGSADEMGSFILNLKNELYEQQVEFNDVVNEKDEKIKELQNKIGQLDIRTEEKADIVKMIGAINTITSNSIAEIKAPSGSHNGGPSIKPLLQAYNRYLENERRGKDK